MNIIRKPFRYQYFHAVYWLIGINIFVFVIFNVFGDRFDQIIYRFPNYYRVPVIHYFSVSLINVLQGRIWTFVTYMFVHGSISHILFNMLGLFIFGTQVERQMGSREFLLFYFVTGALAGVFSFIVYYITGVYVSLIGASGAIFAVELAFAVFFPNTRLYIWGILPMRAAVMVLVFTGIELFSSIFRSGSGIAHLTHLAGFAFAWMYFLARYKVNPWKRLMNR